MAKFPADAAANCVRPTLSRAVDHVPVALLNMSTASDIEGLEPELARVRVRYQTPGRRQHTTLHYDSTRVHETKTRLSLPRA
jgi:hypothetical protein